jgi:hypothetical protein
MPRLKKSAPSALKSFQKVLDRGSALIDDRRPEKQADAEAAANVAKVYKKEGSRLGEPQPGPARGEPG